MRIFQILEPTANTLIAGNQTWYRNLYEPLLELGHEVVLFSAAEGRQAMQHRSPQLRAAFSQKLLDAFCTQHAQK